MLYMIYLIYIYIYTHHISEIRLWETHPLAPGGGGNGGNAAAFGARSPLEPGILAASQLVQPFEYVYIYIYHYDIYIYSTVTYVIYTYTYIVQLHMLYIYIIIYDTIWVCLKMLGIFAVK